MARNATSEGDLHPVHGDEQGAMEGTSTSWEQDISHVNPQLVEIAPHAVAAFDTDDAGRSAESELHQCHDC
jgi:hypothetical protein